MEAYLPSAADIRIDLEGLTHAELQELSRVSGVPFTTLWKIRDGTTTNPGIETVRKFTTYVGAIVGRRPDKQVA